MSHIQAIYRRGVFEPLEPVDLPEDQRVQLSVHVPIEPDPRTWLNDIRAMQATITRRDGYLPDSSSEIAADRKR